MVINYWTYFLWLLNTADCKKAALFFCLEKWGFSSRHSDGPIPGQLPLIHQIWLHLLYYLPESHVIEHKVLLLYVKESQWSYLPDYYYSSAKWYHTDNHTVKNRVLQFRVHMLTYSYKSFGTKYKNCIQIHTISLS